MTQLDLFAEPITAPAVAIDSTKLVQFDAQAWLWAKNPTETRCDRCLFWIRSGDNYWGRCEAKQSWEHEYGECERFSGAKLSSFPSWWLEIDALRSAGGRPLVQAMEPIIEASKKSEVETMIVDAPTGVTAEIRLMEFRGLWAWGHSAVLQGHGLSQSWPQPWRELGRVVLTREEAVAAALSSIDATVSLWRTTRALQ